MSGIRSKQEGDRSSEVKNKAMLQWYERVQGGHVFHGAWLGLFNSAPTFPRFVDLAFSDGALGPPSTDAWAQLPRQYEDIPTQLNQNIQCFDLQTMKAGNPVFGPGTQILTTPLILFGPSMTRLMVTFPAPAPSSSSNLTFTFEMPEPQNLKPLQSTWHSQGKELPKHILFVFSRIQGARKSLKTLKQADEGVVANFYWCIIQWDLVSPRRVQFLRLLERSTTLQHYMWVDHSLGLKRCDIYLFEWIMLALELNDAGVIVSFIDNDDFIELLEKWELSKHWQLLKGVDLVIGQGELDSSSIPPQKIYTGVLAETIKLITAMGIRIWPESEVDHFTCKKFALHSLLASTIEKAGGLAEAPVRVTFTSQGQKFLHSGEWIIKMEYGNEGKYVYRTTYSEKKFVKDFELYHPTRLF
ncbi:hypothetical protein EV368DRAFT_67458 [Lentinula lateritia]|nr:hypothetical protein EV368DRAFT_67458 [Lentinula lateritia]